MCVCPLSVFSAIESTGNPGNLIYILHVIYILLVGVIIFLGFPCQIEVSLPPLIGVFMSTIVHLSTVFVWYPHGIHPNSAHHLLAKLRPTTATTAL